MVVRTYQWLSCAGFTQLGSLTSSNLRKQLEEEERARVVCSAAYCVADCVADRVYHLLLTKFELKQEGDREGAFLHFAHAACIHPIHSIHQPVDWGVERIRIRFDVYFLPES